MGTDFMHKYRERARALVDASVYACARHLIVCHRQTMTSRFEHLWMAKLKMDVSVMTCV